MDLFKHIYRNEPKDRTNTIYYYYPGASVQRLNYLQQLIDKEKQLVEENNNQNTKIIDN